MSLLRSLDEGSGILKAGFLGFQKSGKTYTAIELAIGTREHFGLKGPIAMFDTEGGSGFIRARVREKTGQPLMGMKSRSLVDLIAMVKECEQSGVSVLVVDSVTHVWRETMAAYKKQTNRQSLSFQDWGPIKERWYGWTDTYLNTPIHTIICGRAGWEYEFEENDRGKKELVKTGTKMKAEAEFGFEPSLLVEMEHVDGVHRAIVKGDRFNVIDGLQCDNPTFDFFRPHVELLTPEAHSQIDMEAKTTFDVEDGSWPKEKKEREILAEEIQGLLVKKWPGQTAAEKSAKLEAIEKHFGTRSWTKVENMRSSDLQAGLQAMRAELG